jgi:hypothetical protein
VLANLEKEKTKAKIKRAAPQDKSLKADIKRLRRKVDDLTQELAQAKASPPASPLAPTSISSGVAGVPSQSTAPVYDVAAVQAQYSHQESRLRHEQTCATLRVSIAETRTREQQGGFPTPYYPGSYGNPYYAHQQQPQWQPQQPPPSFNPSQYQQQQHQQPQQQSQAAAASFVAASSGQGADASGAAMKALMKAILNDDSLKAIIAAQAGVLGGPPS